MNDKEAKLRNRKIISIIKNPIYAALSVLVFMFSMYAAMGFFPFGEKLISWCDMNQQVVPLLMNLKDILSGESNILVNHGNAGGMSFLSVFFFFISSPLSLLVIFIQKTNMMSFMNILVALKMALAAATACAFFERGDGERRDGSVEQRDGSFVQTIEQLGVQATELLSEQKNRPSVQQNRPSVHIYLGFTYGLCGYAMHYYQNIMWLDMMYLFPLLVISLERLYFYKKPLMYIITLALMVYANFYIAIMVVIFLLLSMGAHLLVRSEKGDRVELASIFAKSSIFSAMLSAWVWLPSILQISGSARMASLWESLSAGGFVGYYETTLPLLYCTPIIFAALPFINSVKKRERDKNDYTNLVYWLVLFVLTVLPQFVEPINKMWHTGSYMSFPNRYGFIAIFSGLTVVKYVVNSIVISNVREEKMRIESSPVAVALAACAVYFVFFAGKFIIDSTGDELYAYTRTLWGNKDSFSALSIYFVVCLVFYIILFYLPKRKTLSNPLFILSFSMMAFVIASFNFRVYIGSVSQNGAVFESIVELEDKIDDMGFYRVKVAEKLFDVNIVGAIGYNSLSHYTSITSQDYMFAMKKLGYSSYWMEVNSDGGTFFSDALLSNNYVIAGWWDNYPGEVIASTDRYSIYENKVVFPAAVFSYAEPLKLEKLSEGNRLELQNDIYMQLFDDDEGIFNGHSPIENNGFFDYEIEIIGTKALYFDCFHTLSNRLREPTYDSYRIYVNGNSIARTYPSQRQNGILFLGEYTDTSVLVSIEILKDIATKSFGLYSLDMDKLMEVAKEASGAQIDIMGSRVSIEYNSDTVGYLYLSLPNLKGYSVRVNGSKAQIFNVFDNFMAIAVASGENHIVLRYRTPGLLFGILASICAVIIMLMNKVAVLQKEQGSSLCSTALYVLVVVLVVTIVFTVYIFPVIYKLLVMCTS
ncbi:MAG: YfhO family protein [Oscillospiraceae bacterium]|nr:YfhO family protein [Oscillospiraceae bacterium]